jgi:hypothetical protein
LEPQRDNQHFCRADATLFTSVPREISCPTNAGLRLPSPMPTLQEKYLICVNDQLDVVRIWVLEGAVMFIEPGSKPGGRLSSVPTC